MSLDIFNPLKRQSQRGYSLVELMIAMVIGLILISGLSYIYLSAHLSTKNREDLGLLQEVSRAFFQKFGSQIRQSASLTLKSGEQSALYDKNYLLEPAPKDSPYEYQLRTSAITNGKQILDALLPKTHYAGSDNFSDAPNPDAQGNRLDSISIAYLATPPNQEKPKDIPAFGNDCLGQATPAILSSVKISEAATQKSYTSNNSESYFDFPTIYSAYFIKYDQVTKSNTLYCLGSGNPSTPQALLSQVKAFQIEYQIIYDTAQPTYQWKHSVDMTESDWEAIRSARVCIEIYGENKSVSTGAKDAQAGRQQFINCKGEVEVAEKNESRKIFVSSQTFAIRSKI